jgi:hypothetical protein
MPFDTLQLMTCIKYDIYLYYCRKQAGLKTWNPIYSRNACDAFASPCAISPRRRASKDKVHRILKGKSDARQSSLRALDDRLQERELKIYLDKRFCLPRHRRSPGYTGKDSMPPEERLVLGDSGTGGRTKAARGDAPLASLRTRSSLRLVLRIGSRCTPPANEIEFRCARMLPVSGACDRHK